MPWKGKYHKRSKFHSAWIPSPGRKGHHGIMAPTASQATRKSEFGRLSEIEPGFVFSGLAELPKKVSVGNKPFVLRTGLSQKAVQKALQRIRIINKSLLQAQALERELTEAREGKLVGVEITAQKNKARSALNLVQKRLERAKTPANQRAVEKAQAKLDAIDSMKLDKEQVAQLSRLREQRRTLAQKMEESILAEAYRKKKPATAT